MTWLDRLAARARLALAWERVWPALATVLVCAAVFVSLSWLGLWLHVSAAFRMAGVGLLFGASALAIRLARAGWPTRREALARLDRDSGLQHRPVTALEDRLANGGDDEGTRALWLLHRARMEAAARTVLVAPPSPRLSARDPWALRAAALVGLVACAFVAGPEKGARLAAAFDWRSAEAVAQGFRFDAWIDPPLYTGKPPILLSAKAADDESQRPAGTVKRVEAPVGSSLVVRWSGDASFAVDTTGGLTAAAGRAPASISATQPTTAKIDNERHFTLAGDAHVTIKRGETPVAAFDIVAIPDRAPIITLTEKPTANLRGSLTLSYKIEDDYGVTSAEANFAKPSIGGMAMTGRSLAEPPKLPLTLPSGPGGLGTAQTIADLSEHPWAGARAVMTLSAHDEGGNEGKSEPTEVRLPQRPFTKPLAKALVEQRRNLVLNPDDSQRVRKALSALLIAPEHFGVEAGVYLGLVATSQRLDRAKSDDELRDVAGLLWEMALRIEDGDASNAERDLRAAEQQLREALQRDASDEEIKKLTDQLQAALDRYLNELAENMAREDRNADPQADRQSSRSSRMMTQQDLKSMLNQLQEMARSGRLADAQRMLDQLQSILENLRTAKRGRADPTERELNQALDDLDAMTRDEQELRDETFRQGQQQRQMKNRRQQQGQAQQNRRNAEGQRQQNGDEQGDDQTADSEGGDGQPQASDDLRQRQENLRQRQENLRQRLENLTRKMKQLGMSQEKGLDDADGAMNDAEGALGEGEGSQGKAVDAEGRAIDGLRRGAQGLADQMQQQGNEMGQGDGGGTPTGNQQSARGRGYRDDPLGRRSEPNGNGVNGQQVDGREAGATPSQRARKVLEELRRRLGERERPPEELDYIERLMRRY